MRVTLLCDNPNHPVMPYLRQWMEENRTAHEAELASSITEALGGDILFLISCSEIVSQEVRMKYRKTLVMHASDLPRGRGWSPHVWDIIEGADFLVLSLLEAEDAVDSGRIWTQVRIDIPKHFLWDEINDALFRAELSLIDFAIDHMDRIEPREQDPAVTPSYRPRRSPADSRIDPNLPISRQFDLLRICDPERFPAFFDHLGHRYIIRLEKADE